MRSRLPRAHSLRLLSFAFIFLPVGFKNPWVALACVLFCTAWAVCIMHRSFHRLLRPWPSLSNMFRPNNNGLQRYFTFMESAFRDEAPLQSQPRPSFAVIAHNYLLDPPGESWVASVDPFEFARYHDLLGTWASRSRFRQRPCDAPVFVEVIVAGSLRMVP